jgi:TM2 domain-containing membrane protein YozV
MNRSTAIVLSLFLGGFGAHKFYLNQPGMAILYILMTFTIVLIPFVLLASIIDCVSYLVKTDIKFKEQYPKV